MTRLTVKSVQEYAQANGYDLEIKNGSKDKYRLFGYVDGLVTTLTFSYRTLNEVVTAIKEGWLLEGQSEEIDIDTPVETMMYASLSDTDTTKRLAELNSEIERIEAKYSIQDVESDKDVSNYLAAMDDDVKASESYLNDSTISFNDVVNELAKYGYELHRNVGQFFTESKAPYVYFKSGESDYAIHVTYYLDTIIESVTEIVTHKINMIRFHQVASELSKTDDQAGENLTGDETLSDRLTMLEKRLIKAIEQRRIIVRSICAEIGKVILVWMTGIGFGVKESVGKIHNRANRRVQRHARSFFKMLNERVLPKYHIEHF
ncbi:hypothetical protein [Nostoc phage N1]|nr:hypothetical protein [Nostoc phage N1]